MYKRQVPSTLLYVDTQLLHFVKHEGKLKYAKLKWPTMYIYIREVGRLGLYRETGQPGSESFSARVPIICAGRTAASKGGSEAGTPIGGGAAARASARHAPSRTGAAHGSRTHRNDPGCGHILRGVPTQ